MDQLDLDVAGTRVMLAVELYRARHGEYPAALEDLVPAILPAIPKDPWTGQDLRYRRLAPGEDGLGRPYTLYAVGDDREDNGGRIVHRDDYLSIRAVQKKGLDVVFNLPRPPPAPEGDDAGGS
jgi:hypothetical protein